MFIGLGELEGKEELENQLLLLTNCKTKVYLVILKCYLLRQSRPFLHFWTIWLRILLLEDVVIVVGWDIQYIIVTNWNFRRWKLWRLQLLRIIRKNWRLICRIRLRKIIDIFCYENKIFKKNNIFCFLDYCLK